MGIIGSLMYSCINWSPPTYKKVTGTYYYPQSGTAVAIFMTLSSIVAIPVYFVYLFVQERKQNQSKSFKQIISKMMTPQYPEDHPYVNKELKRKISIDSDTESSLPESSITSKDDAVLF